MLVSREVGQAHKLNHVMIALVYTIITVQKALSLWQLHSQLLNVDITGSRLPSSGRCYEHGSKSTTGVQSSFSLMATK